MIETFDCCFETKARLQLQASCFIFPGMVLRYGAVQAIRELDKATSGAASADEAGSADNTFFTQVRSDPCS